MTQREKGLQRGRQAGAGAKDLARTMQETFAWFRLLYPTAGEMDYAREILALDRERLACEPDYTRFPELRGHIDLLLAEREGFMEATGLDDTAAAFYYSWDFFDRRRMNTRYVARWDLLTAAPAAGCTNAFIPDGVDGVTIADNRDIPLLEDMSHLAAYRPEHVLRQDPVHWVQGAVSSAVLLDEEPSCAFPANPQEYDLLPDDCLQHIDDIIDFMSRYNEFWGPANQIWVDRELNAVAVEKSNCRMAVRRPTVNGAIAVTACAYLDPAMYAHQLSCAQRVAVLKGDTIEESMDVRYHQGSHRRYERWVRLIDEEAARGGTLWGALEAVADHAVPYPDRVCLAGESCAGGRSKKENWSVTQCAAVISGPARRCLYRSVQSYADARPVYEYVPRLMLGPGVAMRSEWQADMDAGRCLPAPPVA